MKKIETKLPGVYIIEPQVFGDQRGYFMETWSTRNFEQLGLRYDLEFCYKVDNLYSKACDRGIRFNDPAIGVDWGEIREELLSNKDTAAPLLEDSDCNFVYGEI